jgi:hypothetical protein
VLRPMPIGPVPPGTAHASRAALPTGDRYLREADALEMLFTDDAFLAPPARAPGSAPWQPALVAILQFTGGLSGEPSVYAPRSATPGDSLPWGEVFEGTGDKRSRR